MSEREYMIISLVKDLLGPRDGPLEKLPKQQDPRNEYITGVLAPEMPQRDRRDDIDADVDDQVEEVSDDEQGGTIEGVVVAPPSAFSPALDPKAQPRSAGLSFVLLPDEGDQVPVIDICATWARYEMQEDETWKRHPEQSLLKGVSVNTQSLRVTVGTDIDLYMRVRNANGYYRVSLYLINERKLTEDAHPTSADFIFQPQIRVHCASGQLSPVDVAGSEAADDPYAMENAELSLLYRERPVLARGHLCGVTWKTIDPELPHTDLPSPAEAPFIWTDRGLFSPEDQRLFSPADVRTEFLPCYPIEAPETTWSWPDPRPEFRPQLLAEMWEPEKIHQYLDPLVDGYSAWIDAQEQAVLELPTNWHEQARRNLERCRQVAIRMREGITWLIQDEDVKLAFCFANKAIALQSQWARKGAIYPWRPFQLAFILLNLASIADPLHPDRNRCDLLWFPTGGGKTEAYLGLAAFTLGLRRLRARRAGSSEREDRGAGVSVLSRYTLRLLTIQQFRRALGIITACEFLRVTNLTRKLDRPIGWRPAQCSDTTQLLWGATRFSTGMWVGGNVTPNILKGFRFSTPSSGLQAIAGALEILQGVSSHGYNGQNAALRKDWGGGRIIAEGDPAQVLTCPVCTTILAIPDDGLSSGQHTLHFIFAARLKSARLDPASLAYTHIITNDVPPIISHDQPETYTLSITFTIVPDRIVKPYQIDKWWQEVISQRIVTLPNSSSPELLAARAARPGYFIKTFTNQQKHIESNDFEIFCPNPQCELNQCDWVEQVPLNIEAQPTRARTANASDLRNDKWPWQEIPAFARNGRDAWYSTRMPIPAYTVDEQIYQRCPSLVIATVDKFARLAFEPKAASLFGNVTHYHSRWGFYREGCPPLSGASSSSAVVNHPPKNELHVPVRPFLPPDLIIQDELHLLEGPLGSMVGMYETAIDALCERIVDQKTIRPKYVSSSATVRQAEDQVQALFERNLTPFPPSAIRVDDRFFARTTESHPLECANAGRLYVGISAPGKGAQTPIVRIWSALLQAAQDRKDAGAGEELDAFWTLVGYFNALRELAGAVALYRQDIPQRLQERANRRDLGQHVELSSRASSLDLPSMLDKLGKPWSEDAVLATSMFGTGVDVNRLGLMVVHGQPKTTSAYIQATGRVGRQGGGLVVAFFRVSRPRDLDHYEFFTGYHRMLYRSVEPVTVTPFAPRARERCLGPLSVALLRQGRQIGGVSIPPEWPVEQRLSGRQHSEAVRMAEHRYDPEVIILPDLFERRAQKQPEGRRPPEGTVRIETASELDLWHSIAEEIARATPTTKNNNLVYYESSQTREPERGVILGDAQHQQRQLPVAFENTPNSLRDVEETTQFKE